MPTPPAIDVYQAIADPRRRALLELIAEREQPVQSLVDEFNVSFAAISQHLKILKNASLVQSRAEGRARIYVATPAALQEVHDWTGQYRDFWKARVRRLNHYLDKQR